jgi:hypothetical protein
MRTRPGAASALLLSLVLLLSACGITTSPPTGVADEIEDAAAVTADLAAYEFAWTAMYELSESETGLSELTVGGAGSVDAETGHIESVVTYDEDLLDAARALFADEDIDEVQAFTKIIGEEVFVKGFNVGPLAGELSLAYDEWYEVSRRSQDLTDPFVSSDVLPVDVLPVVVGPLVDADALSTVVDRDFVLDLGTRFSRSLYDFGLRLGGGDFELSVEVARGLIRSLTIEGDDPGSGVDRFAFTIEFEQVGSVVVEPPDRPALLPR